MIGAQQVQMEHIRVCGRRHRFTKTRYKGDPLTVLLLHRHDGPPQWDILRDVKHIPNHRIPFRSWGVRRPSVPPPPVHKEQRGSGSEQDASKRRGEKHGRWGGSKGAGLRICPPAEEYIMAVNRISLAGPAVVE